MEISIGHQVTLEYVKREENAHRVFEITGVHPFVCSDGTKWEPLMIEYKDERPPVIAVSFTYQDDETGGFVDGDVATNAVQYSDYAYTHGGVDFQAAVAYCHDLADALFEGKNV